MIWNIIGSVSNSIAAICAVVAIFVTILNFRSDRHKQMKEKLGVKLRELYKQVIIDDFLEAVSEKINYINENLYKMSQVKFDENTMREISDYMMLGLHDCLREGEIIKLFNRKLSQEIKQTTEKIFDTYSEIINKSMKCKFISRNFEQQITPQWIKLRNSIYACYIEENFDKLDN